MTATKTIFNRMMTIIGLSFIICHLSFTVAHAQVGTWRAYMSYYEPQQIVKAGTSDLFVCASNGLYQYNLNDHSITTFDKVHQLSDTQISLIAWNKQVGRLIIVYSNSNIDLLDLNYNVVNMSALYSKSMMQDKTVNSIYIYNEYAYLATNFGVVKVNMQKCEISESYILNQAINAVAISDGYIYARQSDGQMLTAPLTKNLIDSHSWQTVTADNSLFANDTADWDQYIDLVRTLQPDGPKYNKFGFIRFKNKHLYTCGGGWVNTNDRMLPATVQILDEEKNWEILPDDMTGVEGTNSNAWAFVDMMSVDADPLDPNHIIATGRTGMWEYRNGQFVKYHNKDNSLLKNSKSSTSNKYVLALTSTFDQQGNFWCVVSDTRGDNLVEYKQDGTWVPHSQQELYNSENIALTNMKSLFIDSRGYYWFVNENWVTPSIYCYDPKTDKIINSFKTLINQDGTSYTTYIPYAVTEDLDGNIWLSTNLGPFVIESDRITTPDTYVTQIKVPRNDGTNYADYLMDGAFVNCIVVDGGNRKWMATMGNGLYLISADNMEELAHFTADNSPLLSDIIESLAIDNSTGELFIGTEAGLCSYMTDATEASIEMVKDDVYAYPNPVVSGYDGLITIVGLSLDADVKILTTSGQLVAQGRSNGGTFTWNGRDYRGRRVASGIYMVAAATSDGKKGTVCKIAFIN